MTVLKMLILSLVFALSVGFLVAEPALADGQYGQYGAGSETPSEQPKEEVTHDTVDADLGDNLVLLGGLMVMASLGLFGVARATRGVSI